MLESLVWGLLVAAVATVGAGVRRWPWRWCAVAGLGWGMVFGTLALTAFEPATKAGNLVLLAAIGGGIATIGSERGERDRRARSESILAGQSPTVG